MSKVWRQRRRKPAPGDGQCHRAMAKSRFASPGVVRLARNFDAHGTPCCVLDYTIQKLGNSLDHYLVNWCRCDAAILPACGSKTSITCSCWCGATMPTGLSPYRWTMASRAPLRYSLGGTPYAASELSAEMGMSRIPGSHHRAGRIGVWHFGLTQPTEPKTRALNSPAPRPTDASAQ